MGLYNRDYNRPSGFGNFGLFPPVIKNLLIINGAIFLVMMLLNIDFNIYQEHEKEIIKGWIALMPWGHGFYVWQLISYQFLHGGFSHILFNMFALWMFGAEIENTWGSKKFLIYYLSCGIGAGLLHLFLSPILTGALAPTIGASGAIYGVMIAFAMFFPDRLIFLYFFIPVKAKYFIAFMVVFEFLAVDSVGSGVAHLAHLGGALVGFLFILFDKNTSVKFKDVFRSSHTAYSPPKGVFQKSSWKNPLKKTEPEIEDATYSDVNEHKTDVTQEDIDKILDKISQSGYKNLTEPEKKILFEASRKM